MKVEFTSRSVEDTTRLGIRLGEVLRAGDIICLSGDLGAGKTTLTKGIGQGWGAEENVTSPTFVLIHEHHRPQDEQILYHIDCYRLSGSGDAWGIGLEELMQGSGPVILEWPENIEDALPAERLWVALTLVDDHERHIMMEANGARYVELVGLLS
ncbi:MAG TPA: tRNA (adenosine(37)-N6)-threonylcarbamoyltransferase complex ATPase subunit type 1 TsaE [Aggregatilineaceae bacterium]|nr:tRNA (adenosine(37)-N6)-threonylcarbamoyltransferase complex ATPase subunit type 1 TsaE [Aggregatilineaceae bacterium]